MSTAQKVRIWISVGLGALLFISSIETILSLNSGTSASSGAMVYSATAGTWTWLIFSLVLLAAEGVLVGFTIYRMYRPVPPRPDQIFCRPDPRWQQPSFRFRQSEEAFTQSAAAQQGPPDNEPSSCRLSRGAACRT